MHFLSSESFITSRSLTATKPFSLRPDVNKRHAVRYNSSHSHIVEIYTYTNTLVCMCITPKTLNEWQQQAEKLSKCKIQRQLTKDIGYRYFNESSLVPSVCWSGVSKIQPNAFVVSYLENHSRLWSSSSQVVETSKVSLWYFQDFRG